MAIDDTAVAIFAEALLHQGFSADDELGCSVTYRRDNDSLKICLGDDGTFTAIDANDEVVGEGNKVHELYAVLIANQAISGRSTAPGRGIRRRARQRNNC